MLGFETSEGDFSWEEWRGGGQEGGGDACSLEMSQRISRRISRHLSTSLSHGVDVDLHTNIIVSSDGAP